MDKLLCLHAETKVAITESLTIKLAPLVLFFLLVSLLFCQNYERSLRNNKKKIQRVSNQNSFHVSNFAFFLRNRSNSHSFFSFFLYFVLFTGSQFSTLLFTRTKQQVNKRAFFFSVSLSFSIVRNVFVVSRALARKKSFKTHIYTYIIYIYIAMFIHYLVAISLK